MDTKRICLWSGPRNISTALMYSFAQREDTLVFDEPLYGHYLSHSDARIYHPGADEILAKMENDGNKVIEMMMSNHDKSVLFFKNMTHHLLGLNLKFMKDCIHIILTRDPVEMLPSFSKVIENPTMDDIGYEAHLKLINYLMGINKMPIVVDSKDILVDPKRMLNKICDLVGIPFDENMLEWDKGPIEEDGIWAKYWYNSVHKSTKFNTYTRVTEPIPASLKALLEASLTYYEVLLKMKI